MEDAMMQALVTEAIFSKLDQSKRDELLKSAIVHLIEPEKNSNSWSKGKSKLQVAYEDALNVIAREEVRKAMVEDPKVRAEVAGLVQRGIEKALTHPDQSEEIVGRIASAVANAFTFKPD